MVGLIFGILRYVTCILSYSSSVCKFITLHNISQVRGATPRNGAVQWLQCHQIKRNMKIATQNVKIRRYKKHSMYKSTHGWTTLKKIDGDGNCGFCKLVSLTVFQSSFLLFVTFGTMLGKHICCYKAAIFSSTSNFPILITNKDA